jgi:hypothetical protein
MNNQPDPLPGDWKTHEYDSFLIREKELNKSTQGTWSALQQGLQVTQFPDSSIDASSLKPGSMVGDFKIANGSIQSRDYAKLGTGWSLNSDGTVDGITATVGDLIETYEIRDSQLGRGLIIYSQDDDSAGSIDITGGDSSAAVGGYVYLTGGDATAGNNDGGQVNIEGGKGNGSGAGGWINIDAGDSQNSGGTGDGGFIYLTAGNGGRTSGDGGDVVIRGGNASGTLTGNGNAGLIVLDPGSPNGTGLKGAVQITKSDIYETINNAAILQVDSITQGVLLPRMTTTQRDAISSPLAGLLIYNTSTNKLNIYTTGWEQVTSV